MQELHELEKEVPDYEQLAGHKSKKKYVWPPPFLQEFRKESGERKGITLSSKDQPKQEDYFKDGVLPVTYTGYTKRDKQKKIAQVSIISFKSLVSSMIILLVLASTYSEEEISIEILPKKG